MKDLSFLDKLKVLVDVSSSSGLCIASIFILIFLAFVMITTNRNNYKQTKILYLVIYIALAIVMFIQYGSSFSEMFDYMMNNLFIAVYFPNLAIYLAAIIATNIILWKTVFNFNEDKILKIVNIIIYCIIHYLLVLILNVVNSNELDVFNNTSVYSDSNALALIGLSSLVFMIWIIFIIIYKIIRGRQKKYEVNKRRLPSNIVEIAIPKVVKDVVKNDTTKTNLPPNISEVAVPREVKEVVRYKDEIRSILPPNILEIAVPREVKEVVRYKDEIRSILPPNISEIAVPKEVKEIVRIREEVIPKVVEQPSILDLYSQDKEELKKYENMLTLEDYKIVLDLLKNKSFLTTEKSNVTNIVNEPMEKTISDNNSNYYNYDYLGETIEQPVLDKLLNLRSV